MIENRNTHKLFGVIVESNIVISGRRNLNSNGDLHARTQNGFDFIVYQNNKLLLSSLTIGNC